MVITDFFSDVWETFSHPSPDAEAPKGGASTNTPSSGTDEESQEEADVNKADAAEGGDEDSGHRPSGGDDEEEEEEEETVDPKDALEEGELLISKLCLQIWTPAKHQDIIIASVDESRCAIGIRGSGERFSR